jgi:para-nitrobenzyl esterase
MSTIASGSVNRRSVLKGSLLLVAAGTAFNLPLARAWMIDPVAETTNGKIRGTNENGVHVFKGVRYGDTTGGDNRFRPTQEPTKWGGVQEATSWGASAPQIAENADPFYAWYTTIQPVNEDCLFLNIFTPALNDNGRRPVMVWLHGGSWSSCAGTAPGFDGTNLARAQDVVVVTVNHRLNVFGYIQFDEAEERFGDSGNCGLFDLLAALRWVRDNVSNFGGDPGNVTIFGQSGGAAKVVALMGMPAAAGLFHKAIVESCSGGMRIAGREEAARQANTLARSFGWSKLTGDAFRKLSVEQIIAGLKTVADPFRPVIDGRSFQSDPFYPKAPEFSAHIPTLIGNANTETTYYLQVDPKNFSLQMPDVTRRLMRFLKVDEEGVGQLIDAYQKAYPGYRPSELLTTLTTDYLFKRNTLKIASLQAAAGQALVFYYVFARETPIQSGRIHSPHTSEVPFVFGTTKAAEAQVGTGSDIAPMTERMMTTWASFARIGNPNNGTIPHWQPFSDSGRKTMVLRMDSEMRDDPGSAARMHLESLPYYEYSISRAAFVKD